MRKRYGVLLLFLASAGVVAGLSARSPKAGEELCIWRPEFGPVTVGDTLTLIPATLESTSMLGPGVSCKPLAAGAWTWRSSDPTVLIVAPTGVVSANAPGLAEVTVDVEGRVTSTRVEVVPPVAEIRISPAHQQARVGEIVRYTVVALDSAGGVVPGITPQIYTEDFHIAHRAPPDWSDVLAAGPGTTVIHAGIVHRKATATITVVQ